jgi:microcin C transport system substrate-binding protein
MITGQMPILPKHFYDGKDFDRDFITVALGSGPYVVEAFEFGKYIRYKKNPNYWGQSLNINVGKYNFDTIVVKFYQDDTVRLEGLKAGEFDFMWINSSKQWAKDVEGEKWDKGYLVKSTFKHHNTAGMQGFAFNLRRPMFQSRDVRHALALALDFDWMNTTLFYGQYTANDSFFDNSELAASGLPTPAELALLEPLRQHVPPAVFTEPMGESDKRYGNIRERLRAAKQLLTQVGWQVRNGVLTEVASGQQMRFVVTLVSPAFQRIVEPYLVNLSKLGVQASMKVVDESIYEGLIRTHDFDMVVETFGQSQSPGNEQRDYWHSEAADVEGSRNIVGIKNPAVDALVEAVITAPTRQELVTATQALDRVLWHEYYVVPQWFIDSHRVTYWNKFSYPKTLPLYYNPLGHLMYWWVDADKARELAAAMAANRAVSPGR